MTTLRRNQKPKRGTKLNSALEKSKVKPETAVDNKYYFPIKPPDILPAVTPKGVKAPVAMDSNPIYTMSSDYNCGTGFPGFAYLSQLATRPEYRAMASTLSTELTRKWIEFNSTKNDESDIETDDEAISTVDKIKAIEAELERLNVRKVFQTAAENDAYFGRAQIFIDIDEADKKKPLILDKRTVRKGSLNSVVTVEAIWTTPNVYDAQDPTAPNFYKPSTWFMLGKEVHASRLLTVVTRPLPDILKPAYNFAGMSLSQMAEPYVDNWLRTRQSVADLLYNFSTTILSTSMEQVLQGTDDGNDLFKRVDMFTATRSNRGVMVLDKNLEELTQVNTPLSGLHELQAQAQEHMCSVSRTPAIILTGISPSGLNASSEGEIKVFYDWINAQQEAFWRSPLEIIVKVVQLSLFGEIDPDINFTFVPLYQMTESELSTIRLQNMQTDTGYLDHQVVTGEEVRERLANDPDSGYNGIDTTIDMPEPADPSSELDPELDDPTAPPLPAGDAEFKESEHPRGKGGKFGSGGGGAAGKGKSDKPKGPELTLERKRSPGLSDKERKVEDDFYAAIDADTPGLIEKYKSVNGNVIDPDRVKGLNPEFINDKSLAAAVHEPSSELSKKIYTAALKEKKANGDTSPTIFTAGGSGSGKSTTEGKALEALGAEPGGLMYDSVLGNPDSAKARIDEALKETDGDVGIAYTNAPINKALAMNALRPRAVSIDTLMKAHMGASETFRELSDHYKNDPRVKFTVVNNHGAKEDAAVGKAEDIPKYDEYALREQLVDVANKLHADGKISDERLALLLR